MPIALRFTRKVLEVAPARLIALAMIALALSTAAPAVDWPPPGAVQQRVDEAVRVLDRLEAVAPDSIDEVTDLAVALDFDFDAAVDHVTAQIAYLPYIGVLRGPDGARITRGGNAWDQAVLLASLLKTMGADAQVVAGRLSNDDAARLLAGVFAPPPSPQFTLDVDSLAAIMADFHPDLAQQFRHQWQANLSTADSEQFERQAAAMADTLIGVLSKSGIQVPASRSAAQLVESIAADYAWVRWRIGPGSEWSDVHPAFAAGDASPSVVEERYLDAEVPVEHQHRVAFQLFIERGLADGSGEIELVPVMERWERPTANLFRNQVSLGMGPVRVSEDDSSSVLVPTLNGRVAPRGLAVTELGQTADPGDAGTAAGQLFATLSSRLGNVAGSIGGLDKEGDAPIPRLLGIVLEVGITAPDHEEVVRRRVVDLRSQPADAFPRNAAFETVIDIDVGADDPAETYRRMIDYHRSLIRATPAMMALARGALSPQDVGKVGAYRDLGPARWLDFEVYADAFALPADATTAMFRTGPLIASRRGMSDPQQGVVAVTDILSNPAVVLHRAPGGEITIVPDKVLFQGVRETLIESKLAGAEPGWAARKPVGVIASSDDLHARAQGKDWSPAAVGRAEQDLAAGFVLAPVDQSGPWWWRIDPASGQTLGMGVQGGAEVLEYTIMVAGAALSTYLFYRSVQSCDETYPDNRDMADCCIVGNLAATYATAGVSSGAQAALAKPFAAGAGAVRSALTSIGWEIGGNVVSEITTDVSLGAACRAYLERN